MWPEAGHMALIMAAWVALAQSVLPLWGSLSARRAAWQMLARPLGVRRRSVYEPSEPLCGLARLDHWSG